MYNLEEAELMKSKHVIALIVVLLFCAATAIQFYLYHANNQIDLDNDMYRNEDTRVWQLYFQTEVPEDSIYATIKTSLGDIELILYPSEAPKTVENFVTLAKEGYYDNSDFHRILEKNFVQGGKPEGDSGNGESIWGEESFELETENDLYHFEGAISMAGLARDYSFGSQFFIVTSDETLEGAILQGDRNGWAQEALRLYERVGGMLHLDDTHPVFGYVIDGMDVIDEISNVSFDDLGKPDERITIETIEIIE